MFLTLVARFIIEFIKLVLLYLVYNLCQFVFKIFMKNRLSYRKHENWSIHENFIVINVDRKGSNNSWPYNFSNAWRRWSSYTFISDACNSRVNWLFVSYTKRSISSLCCSNLTYDVKFSWSVLSCYHNIWENIF